MVAGHSDAVVKADAEGGAGRFNGVVALKEREWKRKPCCSMGRAGRGDSTEFYTGNIIISRSALRTEYFMSGVKSCLATLCSMRNERSESRVIIGMG